MSSDYTPFKHQVAGHEGSLSDASGTLFIKPSTDQEIQFYTHINEQERVLPLKEGEEVAGDDDDDDDDDDQYGMRLIDWMPTFMGTLQNGLSPDLPKTKEVQEQLNSLTIKPPTQQQELKDNKDTTSYLVLENLLHGFRKPCIVDIKLGSKLTDHTVSDEKRQRLAKVSASTTSGSLSYRVCGMKIYNSLGQAPIPESLTGAAGAVAGKNSISVDSEGYTVFDKYYGRTLTKDTVKDHFQLFFRANQLSQEQQDTVIRNTFTRLQMLYNCLLDKEVRIVSGSLLIVFEADSGRWNEMDNEDMILRDGYVIEGEDEEDSDEDEDNKIAPLSLLSLIDFAHSRVTPGKGPDENIIVGVENLMNLLEEFI
ncbi:hypothetical protein WICPIJ_009850 [Wickerhamomyces pijperi]|uniref:Kinase n=1 Tax=Wickerhamomyces pijperi TaxID=599730 RepID=A0A9P8PJV1_WICPI|nr:hypothetical protein WICPIJ_009850 [Wickerhamomyces pijperi]